MKMRKSTIGLVVAALVCLVLAFVSAKYSVSRTIKAIDNIGEIAADEESKERLDLAMNYYSKLDPNLKLEDKITNADTLTEAKLEFVRLSIKSTIVAKQRRQVEGYTDEDLQLLIDNTRALMESYLTPEEYESLDNYEAFLEVEASFSADGNASEAAEPQEEEVELPLC